MVILGIFNKLFSTFKMKNHAMNSSMSLLLFYVSDYTNESEMQLKVSNSIIIPSKDFDRSFSCSIKDRCSLS